MGQVAILRSEGDTRRVDEQIARSDAVLRMSRIDEKYRPLCRRWCIAGGSRFASLTAIREIKDSSESFGEIKAGKGKEVRKTYQPVRSWHMDGASSVLVGIGGRVTGAGARGLGQFDNLRMPFSHMSSARAHCAISFNCLGSVNPNCVVGSGFEARRLLEIPSSVRGFCGTTAETTRPAKERREASVRPSCRDEKFVGVRDVR